MDFYNNQIELNALFYESHKLILQKVLIDLGHGDKCDEYLDKYLGDAFKVKKRKDPDLPKRALSSYLYFCSAYREQIKKDNPEASMTDISKLLGKKWKSLQESEKEPYETLHLQDKSRYEEEYEIYQENKGC